MAWISQRHGRSRGQANRDKESGDAGASPNERQLLLVHEVPAAILLPASFVALAAERLFLAVADRFDAAGIDSRSSQSSLHGASALVSQTQVVLGGPTLVAVSFDRDVDVRMLAQELSIGLHR